VRYWTLSVLGIGLFLGSLVLFNVQLVKFLEIGTCASGNVPYEIAPGYECPEGTGSQFWLFIGSFFGMFFSPWIYAARGTPPSGRRSGFAWPLLAWGIFFTATGAVSLIASLTSDTMGPDGELGGIIVGITFLVMGVPALALVAFGLSWGKRRIQRSAFAGELMGIYRQTADDPKPSSRHPRSDGDTIDKLERLQRLRESGALTDAEFEDQKARILGGR